MFNVKDIILGALTNTAEEVEEVSLETGLQTLHDEDVAIWAEVCAGLQLAAIKLGPKVKGKFPAALIEGLQVSVSQSQQANPVTSTPAA